jgi:hypothetical protein
MAWWLRRTRRHTLLQRGMEGVYYLTELLHKRGRTLERWQEAWLK